MIFKVTSRVARWGWLLFLPCFGCSRSHLPDRKSITLLFVSGVLLLTQTSNANTIELSTSSEIATAGYYQLTWHGSADNYELQESATKTFDSFSTIYQGLDTATVISGKPNNDYFYRVRASKAGETTLSNIIHVNVSHHSLNTAWMFFYAGLMVFIVVVITIIKGNRQQA